ncbi:MAG: helix-hairpin-helix domain-containing protein [Verrucomicrobia bacterium]|nr:helix-hairpin-helix domain-containing protein [Verrucomicrobiota bacterium]
MKTLSIILALALAPSLRGEPLQQIERCVLVPAAWADGDSFGILTPAGKELTIRLYGADCMEWHVNDATDERRLRAQRRYFGITDAAPNPRAAIDLAKEYGKLAAEEVVRVLDKPFTIHTSFADARGDGRHPRIYAFVTGPDGTDLAAHLVKLGLARAYGVYRETPDARTKDDYRAQLADLELQAAKRGLGVWSHTDWNKLPQQRQDQRNDDEEIALAVGKQALTADFKLDPNTAARDELMKLPGIGEEFANRIIEGRPYLKAADLLFVPGIGPQRFKAIQPYLKFPNP